MFTASKSCPCTGILKSNFSPAPALFVHFPVHGTVPKPDILPQKHLPKKFQLTGQRCLGMVDLAVVVVLFSGLGCFFKFKHHYIFLQTNQPGIKSSVVCPPPIAPGVLIQTPFSRRIWCYQSKLLFSPVHLFTLQQMNIS